MTLPVVVLAEKTAIGNTAPATRGSRDAAMGKRRAPPDRELRAMKQARNVGSFDAAVRVTAAGVLFIVANHGCATAGWCGAGLLASAVTHFCPLWLVLGVETCRREKIYQRPLWPPDEGL